MNQSNTPPSGDNSQIFIKRDGDRVSFVEVSVDATQTVFFTNLDPKEAHWPTLATNQPAAYPPANSSQCTLPTGTPPYQVPYGCQIKGHENEKGTVNVFAALSGPLDQKGKPIP